jgi:hypothetical protein
MSALSQNSTPNVKKATSVVTQLCSPITRKGDFCVMCEQSCVTTQAWTRKWHFLNMCISGQIRNTHGKESLCVRVVCQVKIGHKAVP